MRRNHYVGLHTDVIDCCEPIISLLSNFETFLLSCCQLSFWCQISANLLHPFHLQLSSQPSTQGSSHGPNDHQGLDSIPHGMTFTFLKSVMSWEGLITKDYLHISPTFFIAHTLSHSVQILPINLSWLKYCHTCQTGQNFNSDRTCTFCALLRSLLLAVRLDAEDSLK